MSQRREYLSPDKAAALLGWVGSGRAKRMLRVMKAKEHLLGKPIMVRMRGARGRTTYKLTKQMLQRHCAELYIATQDELVSDVKRHLSAIDGRVQAIVDERTAPEFEELRAADAKMASALGGLANRTNLIDQRLTALEQRRNRT